MDNWTRDIPAEDCFCWVEYRGKRGVVRCPAEVVVVSVDAAVMIHSLRGDDWVAGPDRGGDGPRSVATFKVDDTLRFGPRIEPPAAGDA